MAQNVIQSLGAPPIRRHVQENQGVGPNVVRCESEWDARESQRQRELEEARARAAQMEKTMKWWSDCTANWREKWSKVRNERNKARDELKQMRSSLDTAAKEANNYKREKGDLEIQIVQLKHEIERIHALLMKHAKQFDKSGDSMEEQDKDIGDGNGSPCNDMSSIVNNIVNSEDGLIIKGGNDAGESRDLDIEEYILQGAVPKQTQSSYKNADERKEEEKRLIEKLSKGDCDEEFLLQKISMLQLRLEEVAKSLQAEREEKAALRRNLEKLTHDYQDMRDKCEEFRGAKQDAVRELLTIQEQHRAELRIFNNSLQEEVNARDGLEKRLYELRSELERLQTENATEWGKRERLETEKAILERDNKKLRVELRELQDRTDRRDRPVSGSSNESELRCNQQELAEKKKEIADLRFAHGKLKKLHTETNTELGHAIRRAEQYEGEVKRLRSRVEELKRELAAAEDEVDSATGQVRRMQRTNEELNSQIESLRIEIQHLQTRLLNYKTESNILSTTEDET